jgi:hypothetical protein
MAQQSDGKPKTVLLDEDGVVLPPLAAPLPTDPRDPRRFAV